ncbi:hypothetical protein [Streptomyces thioluteus]|uniref:hypothetical protein n=1 Tax=Streptomyces thioluteus TaxID=66431 RepID=UPI0031EA57FF
MGAWIVPNYVDRSLLCYAPTGEPLGELRLELRDDASTAVGWGPLPDSRTRTIDALRDTRPQLSAFARELAAKGPGAFADLMATIDGAAGRDRPGQPVRRRGPRRAPRAPPGPRPRPARLRAGRSAGRRPGLAVRAGLADGGRVGAPSRRTAGPAAAGPPRLPVARPARQRGAEG